MSSIRRISVLLVLVLSFVSSQKDDSKEEEETANRNIDIYSYYAGVCETPTGEEGRCIEIGECPQLISQSNYNPSYFNILRESNCGYSNFEPKVCCPKNKGSGRPNGNNGWRPDPPKRPRPQPPRRPRPEPQKVPPTGEPWWGGQDVNPWQTTQRPIRRPTTEYNWLDTSVADSWQRPTPPTRRPPIRQTSTTSTTTTTQSSRRPSGDKYDRVDSHPNKRLLPLGQCGHSLDDKIIGGTKAEPEEFPWMALIKYKTRNGRSAFVCGGALISDKYVLTAAHCLDNPDLKNFKLAGVRLGEYDLSKAKDCPRKMCLPPPVDIEVEKVIVHPNYKSYEKSQHNDIGILRLRSKVKTSTYIQPICLPFNNILRKDYVGQELTVAGWGRTTNEGGSESPVKLKVDVPVVSKKDCEPFYKRNNMNIIESQFCAGGVRGKDSCQGDSGGPLMSSEAIDGDIKWHVIGVVSIGPKSCGTDAAVYTRVADYVDWILDNIKE